MKTKMFDVQYKDEGTGFIEGYASTWTRKADSYGEIVAKGAFTDSLKNDWNGGKGIPFLWAHQMDNLKSFIGTAEADEDSHGLHFKATFDDTEEAQKVRQLFKDGRLKKFSFAYDVKDWAVVTLEDGAKATELRKIKLHEISAVAVPANPEAEVVEVKSGRRNSKQDEDALKAVISALQDAVANLQSLIDIEDDSNGGEDDSEANAAAEEQKGHNPAKESLLASIKKYEEEETK